MAKSNEPAVVKRRYLRFFVSILNRYANEAGVTTRSTSDLSPLETWLIGELFNSKKV